MAPHDRSSWHNKHEMFKNILSNFKMYLIKKIEGWEVVSSYGKNNNNNNNNYKSKL